MNPSDKTAFSRLLSAEPVLVGCRRAGEAVPGFRRNLILHSGPPVAFDAMRGPHRDGVVGAALHEGLARDTREAEGMIRSGEIELAPANDWRSGAPGAGITSYSMPVLVVREATGGGLAFAPPIEGGRGGGLAGWGVYTPEIAGNLRRIADYFAPLLTLALERAGGIPVVPLFAEGLLMGDEEHTRQAATDKVLLARMVALAADMDAPAADRIALLAWIGDCRRFAHHVGCASAVASLRAAAGVPGATLVTAMGGNGVEFGVKTSGGGDRWFAAPAPSFTGRYFSPEHGDADAAPWLGDSSNVEAWGLGGMAAAAAPALLALRGQTLWDGIAQCEAMARICAGVNPRFAVPSLPGGWAPSGILPGRVTASGVTPVLHGGILSRTEGGQIGVGFSRAPLACFAKAMA